MEMTMTTDELYDALNDQKPSAGELVKAKTIYLALKIGRFGNTRKTSLAPVTVDADKSLLSLSKQLLSSPELQAVAKYDAQVAAKIRALAYKSMFKGGVYLLPLSMVTQAEEILKEAEKHRSILVDAAVAVYEQRRDETAARLGVAFNPTDYPTRKRFRSAFYLEYSYLTFETPSKLAAISSEIFQSEVEKSRKKLQSVTDECQQAMRAGALSLVEHLSDRLAPGEDGKQKQLRASAINNLNEFLSTFELRDVTDDAQLGEIVIKARAVMQGLDAKVLKSDELVRQKIAEDLANIKNALDPLVIDKATRAISFEEDEEVDDVV